MDKTLILIFFGISTVFWGWKVIPIILIFLQLITALLNGRVRWPGPRIHDPDPSASAVRERLGVRYENLFPTFVFNSLAVFGAFILTLLTFISNTPAMSGSIRFHWSPMTIILLLGAFIGAFLGLKKAQQNMIQLKTLLSDRVKGAEPREIDGQTARSAYAIEHPLVSVLKRPSNKTRAVEQFYESVRCHQDGDEQRALILYQEAIHNDPSLHENARNELRKMVAGCNPANAGAIFYWIGIHSGYLLDWQQAKEAYEDAVNAFTQIGYQKRASRACNHLGNVKMLMGDPSAMDEFEKAIQLDPNNGLAYISIGTAYYRISERGDPRFEKALDAFANAIMADSVTYSPFVSSRLRSIGYTWKEDLEDILHRADRKLHKKEKDCVATLPESDSPQPADAWQEQAHRLAAQGQWEEAISCLDRGLDLNPRCASAWYDKAHCLGALGQLEQAISCYEQALHVNPQMASAWFSKALVEECLGRSQAASDSYSRFIAISPAEDAEQIAIARVQLSRLGSSGESEAEVSCDPVEAAPTAPPRDAAAWLKEGQRLYDLQRHNEALFAYDQALALDPQNENSWKWRGSILIALGRHEEAVTSLDQALEIQPQDIEAWYFKATVLSVLGKTKQAMACWDQVLDIKPQDTAAWSNKGSCLAKLGRQEEAITCFDQALGLEPQNSTFWKNKAEALARLSRFDEAITCLTRALDHDPDSADIQQRKLQIEQARQALENGRENVTLTEPVSSVSPDQPPRQPGDGRALETIAYYDISLLVIDLQQDVEAATNEANLLALTGRHEEAIQCFDQLLSTDPRNAYLWCNKALSLTTLGLHEAAIACCDRALSLDTGFSEALNNKGISLSHLSRREEALACFDQILNLNARNSSAWNNKGIVLAAQGYLEKALTCYDRALSLDPKNAKAWFNRAIVEEIKGRSRDAVNSYKRFLALAPDHKTTWIEYAQGKIDDLESR